jgi:hypothetical protein
LGLDHFGPELHFHRIFIEPDCGQYTPATSVGGSRTFTQSAIGAGLGAGGEAGAVRFGWSCPRKKYYSRRFVPTRLALLLTLGRLTDSHRTRQSSQPVVIRCNLPQPKTSASYPFESGGEPILCCLGRPRTPRRRRSIEGRSLAGFPYVLPARLYNGFALPDVRERLC